MGTDKFEIDSRAVVVPATKGRIVRHRPRINKWKVTFGVEWDDLELGEDQVKKIIEDMGKKVGLLEYRPACKGRFGKCKIIKWKKD